MRYLATGAFLHLINSLVIFLCLRRRELSCSPIDIVLRFTTALSSIYPIGFSLVSLLRNSRWGVFRINFRFFLWNFWLIFFLFGLVSFIRLLLGRLFRWNFELPRTEGSFFACGDFDIVGAGAFLSTTRWRSIVFFINFDGSGRKRFQIDGTGLSFICILELWIATARSPLGSSAIWLLFSWGLRCIVGSCWDISLSGGQYFLWVLLGVTLCAAYANMISILGTNCRSVHLPVGVIENPGSFGEVD